MAQSDTSPQLLTSEDSGNMEPNEDISLTNSNPNSGADSDSHNSSYFTNATNNNPHSNDKSNPDLTDEKDMSNDNIDITKIDKDERELRIYCE